MPASRTVRRLRPLSDDVEAAVALATDAIERTSRAETPPQDPGPIVTWVTARLRAGSVEGRLYRIGPEYAGVVLWDGPPEFGLHVEALHLAERFRSSEEYGGLIDRLRSEVAPIAFFRAGLAGLSDEEEAALASARGFARFGRSEMRLPPGAAVPETAVPPGIHLRPVRPDDEPAVAAVHAAAFGEHFDYYLFRRHSDPKQDSLEGVHDMLSGHWGEFLPWASFLAEQDPHRVVGACLFVRASFGPLLISLHVDPAVHGRGIGRALTVASVRALRDRGETVIALNVTEGNRRAVEMYARLGFVRAVGPGWSWYATDLVPVAPDGSPSRSAPPPAPARPGSPARAVPRTRSA